MTKIKEWYSNLGPKGKFAVAFGVGVLIGGGTVEFGVLTAIFGV